MTEVDLQKKIQALSARLETLESVEAIKKLQRAYGYYIEHGMAEEILGLFSDEPDTMLWHAAIGSYKGREGLKRFFGPFTMGGADPEFLHQVILLSPIIDVAPNGREAKGRWYGAGTVAIPHPSGVKQTNMGVIYENDYVKESGHWKIKVLRIYVVYDYSPMVGIVRPERVADMGAGFDPGELLRPDEPDHTNPWYPSGYIVPFHFAHPVTGQRTREAERNAMLKPTAHAPHKL